MLQKIRALLHDNWAEVCIAVVMCAAAIALQVEANRVTDRINSHIMMIEQHLQQEYGQVGPQEGRS